MNILPCKPAYDNIDIKVMKISMKKLMNYDK